jgi:hypothetical protein
MGHHQNRRPGLGTHFSKEAKYFSSTIGVEAARGLVGEDQGRAVDQGTGHCNPLLLPARELSREGIEALGDPQPFGKGIDAPAQLLSWQGVEAPGQGDVVARAQLRQQVERLKDKTDLTPP